MHGLSVFLLFFHPVARRVTKRNGLKIISTKGRTRAESFRLRIANWKTAGVPWLAWLLFLSSRPD